jgi:predicted RNA-binding Zn-ribbon protein involved in translation (DUF1610 family)
MSDLIRRQAVCDWLKWYGNDAVKEGYKPSIIYAWKHIRDDIPSASKAGKWITIDDAYNRIAGRCSSCGWEAHLYEDDVVGMPFCPNCGAYMKGERVSEDD